MQPGGISPSQEEIRAALDRILASRPFARAAQQSQFLRFVVEEAIQGRASDLKEYSIGAALRGPSFNGDFDAIVRVQAGNVRKKLTEYYAGPGAYEPFLIEIPIPGYVPAFRRRSPMPPARRPAWRRRVMMLTSGSALLAAVGAIVLWPSDSTGTRPLRIDQITRDGGSTSDPAVSRDGRLLVFASDRAEPGNDDIWIRALDGGEPRRLTSHPATDSTPDISPDSQTVVFRSSRDGGGIYVVPAAGGVERRIADGGFSPRYSPDGDWIAYSPIEPSGRGSIYVVPAQGGNPRRVELQDMRCSCPLWTPDGKAITFAVNENATQDWWSVPFNTVADGPVAASNSGLLAAMRRQNLEAGPYVCHRDWLGDDLVLSVPSGLFRVGMKSGSWTVGGQITQILPPIDMKSVRTVREASGKISVVYEHYYEQIHIWAIPRPADLIESTGDLRQVEEEMTVAGLAGSRPSLSSDGRFLVFSNGGSPHSQARLVDLQLGTRTLLSPEADEDRPVISHDGDSIAWRRRAGGLESIYAAKTADPTHPRPICTDCGEPRDWSPDRRNLLYVRDGTLWLLDIETGSKRALLPHGPYEVFHASFSPEGRRLAMVLRIPGKGKIQGVVAAFNGTVAPESTWTPITEETYELSMEWAPEGHALLYFNLRDGSRCLWEQKLDTSGLRPIGEAVGIRHFHHQRRYPSQGSWIAPAKSFIGVNLSEGLSNIYRLWLP